MTAMGALAVSCSVPYRFAMDEAALCASLLTGTIPDEYAAHLQTALGEAPFELLLRAVMELDAGQRDMALQNMQHMADSLGCGARIRAWLSG